MYPALYYVIFFRFFRFSKYLLIIFIRIQEKPKHTVCSPKGWLNASTALDHPLMPSAQRWADNRCCGETRPGHRVPIPIKGGSYSSDNLVGLIMLSEIVGFCGSRVYMTTYLFFNAFVFYLRSVGYIALYWLIFQNCRNWKFSTQPFTAGGAERRPPGRPRMSPFGGISNYFF